MTNYTVSENNLREEEEKTTSFFPINKKTGLVTAAILMVLGILAFFAPFAVGVGLGYLVTAGLGVYGVSQIIAFFRTPSETRNGWNLISGTLLLVFTFFSLWTALGNTYGSVHMISTLAFLVGFFSLAGGIDQILTFLDLRRTGIPGAGWLMASGIFSILLCVILLLNPVMGWFTMSAVWGVYLTFSGVALLAESLSGSRARRS